MEALQLLKFLLKKEHLDFTRGWATSEVAMSTSIMHRDLCSLSMDDADAALDDMLKELSIYEGEL